MAGRAVRIKWAQRAVVTAIQPQPPHPHAVAQVIDNHAFLVQEYDVMHMVIQFRDNPVLARRNINSADDNRYRVAPGLVVLPVLASDGFLIHPSVGMHENENIAVGREVVLTDADAIAEIPHLPVVQCFKLGSEEACAIEVPHLPAGPVQRAQVIVDAPHARFAPDMPARIECLSVRKLNHTAIRQVQTPEIEHAIHMTMDDHVASINGDRRGEIIEGITVPGAVGEEAYTLPRVRVTPFPQFRWARPADTHQWLLVSHTVSTIAR
ncbi:MAG: hypothetical protein BWY76_02677 [bacterium ADurb.Bin429]|nr:MAG: hypothetical protein BWY76_02677 [bacterium ADurb.Bin429]